MASHAFDEVIMFPCFLKVIQHDKYYILSRFICCSSCKLDMLMFPYDTQICHLEFGNFAEPDFVVNVSIQPDFGFALPFYSESNEFVLKSADVYIINWQVSYMQFKYHMHTQNIDIKNWVSKLSSWWILLNIGQGIMSNSIVLNRLKYFSFNTKNWVSK